jgi:hypothetical protein
MDVDGRQKAESVPILALASAAWETNGSGVREERGMSMQCDKGGFLPVDQ